MKKRMIGLLLVLCMVLSLMPVLSAPAAAAESWLWPVDGCYNMYRGYNLAVKHKGIDIDAPSGTVVRASKSGVVTVSKNSCPHANANCSCNGGAGNYVQIRHDDGTYTRYLHLQLNSPIALNATVSQGDYVGRVGSSGDSDAYHLHFEIMNGSDYRTDQINDNPTDSRHSYNYGGPYTPAVSYIYSLSYDPQGCLDGVTGGAGSVSIRGWAFDRDDLSRSLEIHVYIGGASYDTGEGHGGIIANVQRTDVNDAFPGVGNYHGFDTTIQTAKTGTQTVYVYAINVGGGTNVELGHSTVNITPAHSHSMQYTPKKDATCTEEGNKEYWYCTGCKKYYSDANGNNEITLASTVLAKTDHDLVETVHPATCSAHGYSEYHCKNCSYSYSVYDETAYTAWSTTEPVGVEEDLIQVKTQYRSRSKELTTGSSSTMTGWTLYDTTTSWSSYGPWSGWQDTAVSASDSREVNTQTVYPYYYFYCTHCGLGARYPYYGGTCEICGNSTIPYSTGTVEWYTNPWSDSTPWGTGTGKYYQYINGYIFWNWTDGAPKTQYRFRDRSLITTYHFYRWTDWSDWTFTEAEANDHTEIETRQVYRYLSGDTGVQHQTELRNAAAASCTAQGYTGDQICTVCGETVSTGEVIPALGHSWDAGVVTQEPTTSVEGVKTFTCERCGETRTESIPKLEPVDANPFSDVEKGKFYYEPVYWAISQDPQITTGVDATHFEPDRTCTRAHVVTFLWRANGCPEPQSLTSSFKDVKNTSKYYYKAVLWAAEQEITTGYSDGTFRPDDECTRGQVVTFLWRAEGQPNPAGVSNPFTDVPSGKYYTYAVLWALQNNITTGRTPTTFCPDDACTRGHVVTFLYRDLA